MGGIDMISMILIITLIRTLFQKGYTMFMCGKFVYFTEIKQHEQFSSQQGGGDSTKIFYIHKHDKGNCGMCPNLWIELVIQNQDNLLFSVRIIDEIIMLPILP